MCFLGLTFFFVFFNCFLDHCQQRKTDLLKCSSSAMNQKGRRTPQETAPCWNLPREMKFGCGWEMEPSMGTTNVSPPLLGFFFLKPSKEENSQIAVYVKKLLLGTAFLFWTVELYRSGRLVLMQCIAIPVSEMSWIHWVVNTIFIALFFKEKNKGKIASVI